MSNHTKLGVVAFGFAWGLTWALGLLILGWAGWLFGWGIPMTNIIGSLYIGFKPTFWGAVIGAIWGFVDWFIGGVIVALIYNACSCGKRSE